MISTNNTGSKRVRETVSEPSETEGIRLPVVKIDEEQELLSTSKHSRSDPTSLTFSRHRKRTKLTSMRENRKIQKAAAAMQEQLNTFEQVQEPQRGENSDSSFDASSSFFFELAREVSESSSSSDNYGVSEDYELTAMTQSLRLAEGSVRQHRRRRGGISVVMPSKR